MVGEGSRGSDGWVIKESNRDHGLETSLPFFMRPRSGGARLQLRQRVPSTSDADGSLQRNSRQIRMQADSQRTFPSGVSRTLWDAYG